MRRYVIIIILLLLTAAAGFLYFSRDETVLSGDNPLYQAVPVSSPFFFEFNSLKSIPFKNRALDELAGAGVWPHFFRFSQKLDTLIENNSELTKKLRNSSFVLSFGFAGRDELVPLVIVKAVESNRQAALESLLKMAWPPESFSYNSKEYGKYTITGINNAVNENPVFWSFADGFLLVSAKSILVEQSIRQLLAAGIDMNPYFSLVSRSANSRSGFSLFLNHPFFSEFAKQLVRNKTENSTDEFGETNRVNARREMEAFRNFAAWSELDFRFNEDYLLLSGISAADDSLHHFLSIFARQQPVRSGAENMLPDHTSFFCSYAFSDKEAFFNALDVFFTHSDEYYHREERMQRFDRGTRSNFRKTFREIVHDEIIVATTTIPVNPDNITVFFVLNTRDRSNAEEKLMRLLKNYAARNEMKWDTLKSEYSVNGKETFPIYRFPYPSFPGIWMGSPFGIAEARFITFFGNSMVFANTERGIRDYLRSMVLEATLAKNTDYQRFKQKASSRANINVYLDVNRAFGFREKLLSGKLQAKLEEKEESVRKFSAVNWQVQCGKDIYFNSVLVDYNPDAREEALTTWQSTIGSNIIMKPQFVVNHYDSENPEIILQDEQNHLHQLTGEGKVRWSISLPGPVLGEIHQVDYYRNGKLQYLFNTKEKLYLVDRDGNNVVHFPVDLSSPATNGVNVFDYNNNRDYRYFIAHENKRVTAYDKSANIVTGWEFNQTEQEVTTPVQHFRIGNRDYIVFKDKTKVYIQNRRGQTRVKTSAWFENSKNPLLLDLNGTPKIVATDVSGTVHYIYFNGKHEERKTGRFSGDHFFAVDDLDGNSISDFIFIDGNELVVMDESGKKLFTEKFANPVSHPPNIYTFGPKLKKVGVVEATSNRIYLFNPNGKQHQGFPFHGNSEFSIGKLTDGSTNLNLVVGSEGGKLYNYTLD